MSLLLQHMWHPLDPHAEVATARTVATRQQNGRSTVLENWTWRTSGIDGNTHAFAAEGGFIAAHTVSVLLHQAYGECFVHQAEVYRSLCGAEIPIAALMPHEQGADCPGCARVTTAPCELAA